MNNSSRNAGWTCAATPKSAAPYSERVDFEAVTAAGVTVRTFDDPKAAKAWVVERRGEFPGLHIMEVTHSTRRRRITWLRSVPRAPTEDLIWTQRQEQTL